MSMATSQLIAKMAELRHNRANADVTINCEGKVIMVHSLVLDMRYCVCLYFYNLYTFLYGLVSKSGDITITHFTQLRVFQDSSDHEGGGWVEEKHYSGGVFPQCVVCHRRLHVRDQHPR